MIKGGKRVTAAAAAEKEVALNTSELQGSLQVQVEKKRPRDETDDAAEPDKKLNKAPEDTDEAPAPAQAQAKTDLVDLFAPMAPQGQAPAAAQAQAPPAQMPVVQEIKRSPHVIYPDQYKSFDKKLIAFSKDPQASKEGGGQILFMSYVYQSTDPVSGAIRTATKPFMLNTPNGMHLPTGVMTWPDGKVTTLLSTGREFEANPIMADLRNVFDQIQERCIEVIIEKEWNSPNPNTVEAITDNFTPIMFVGMGAKGEQYPPSIKASVTVVGNNRTEIFQYAAKPPLPTMLPAEVVPGSQGTAIIHVPWIYRKRLGKLWKFSVRVNVFQIVVELPNAGANGAGAQSCAVVY